MSARDLGDFLKEQRVKLGWSQKKVATKLNITQSYVTRLETGGKVPGYNVLNSLAELFEVTPGFLTELLLGKEEKITEPDGEPDLLYWLSTDKNISPSTKRILENIIRQEYEQTKKDHEDFLKTRERKKDGDTQNPS